MRFTLQAHCAPLVPLSFCKLLHDFNPSEIGLNHSLESAISWHHMFPDDMHDRHRIDSEWAASRTRMIWAIVLFWCIYCCLVCVVVKRIERNDEKFRMDLINDEAEAARASASN